MRSSSAVDLGQRAGDLHGATALQRSDEQAHVVAVERRVAHEGVTLARRDRADVGVDGQRLDAVEGHRLAVGAHDLLVEVEAATPPRRRLPVGPAEAIRPAERPARPAAGRPTCPALHVLGAAVQQRGVDLVAQLLADRDVREGRGQQDGHRHGCAGEEGQAPAKAHGSARST